MSMVPTAPKEPSPTNFQGRRAIRGESVSAANSSKVVATSKQCRIKKTLDLLTRMCEYEYGLKIAERKDDKRFTTIQVNKCTIQITSTICDYGRNPRFRDVNMYCNGIHVLQVTGQKKTITIRYNSGMSYNRGKTTSNIQQVKRFVDAIYQAPSSLYISQYETIHTEKNDIYMRPTEPSGLQKYITMWRQLFPNLVTVSPNPNGDNWKDKLVARHGEFYGNILIATILMFDPTEKKFNEERDSERYHELVAEHILEVDKIMFEKGKQYMIKSFGETIRISELNFRDKDIYFDIEYEQEPPSAMIRTGNVGKTILKEVVPKDVVNRIISYLPITEQLGIYDEKTVYFLEKVILPIANLEFYMEWSKDRIRHISVVFNDASQNVNLNISFQSVCTFEESILYTYKKQNKVKVFLNNIYLCLLFYDYKGKQHVVYNPDREDTKAFLQDKDRYLDKFFNLNLDLTNMSITTVQKTSFKKNDREDVFHYTHFQDYESGSKFKDVFLKLPIFERVKQCRVIQELEMQDLNNEGWRAELIKTYGDIFGLMLIHEIANTDHCYTASRSYDVAYNRDRGGKYNDYSDLKYGSKYDLNDASEFKWGNRYEKKLYEHYINIKLTGLASEIKAYEGLLESEKYKYYIEPFYVSGEAIRILKIDFETGQTVELDSFKLPSKDIGEFIGTKIGGKPRKNTYEAMKVDELRAKAKIRKIKGYSKLSKSDLIDLLRKKQRTVKKNATTS